MRVDRTAMEKSSYFFDLLSIIAIPLLFHTWKWVLTGQRFENKISTFILQLQHLSIGSCNIGKKWYNTDKERLPRKRSALSKSYSLKFLVSVRESSYFFDLLSTNAIPLLFHTWKWVLTEQRVEIIISTVILQLQHLSINSCNMVKKWYNTDKERLPRKRSACLLSYSFRN